MSIVLRIAAVLALPVLLAGCSGSGPAIVPVSGTVTLDGVPVAEANVMFAPVAGGRPAEGRTDAAGKFSLSTEKPNDGAMEGDYEVTVTGVRTVGAVANPDGTSGDISQVREEWFLPQKYARRDSSGLTQKVIPGMPAVELKLTAK
jgi:hypothetical protein